MQAEWRVFVLMAWLVALLFLGGRAGFRQVLLLSAATTVGYALLVAGLAQAGTPVSPGFEIALAGAFWIVTAFAAFVFERWRRERSESGTLRRQLGDLALTDSLTSLPNRRQLEQTLRAELARRRRHGGAVTVALLDLDQHPAGDAVLVELATLVRGHLREGDVGARYGGDAFSVVMVGAGRPEAEMAVERLRAMVEGHPFHGRHLVPGGRLTISGGIATAPDDGIEYEELLGKAEQALAEARNGGGNRVGAASLS
jgi:diguanylate cyclase (GGDEF)-like protein